MKLGILFVRSAGILLIITALAKLSSAFGNAEILQSRDPLLVVSFKSLLLIVGSLELLVAFICLLSTQVFIPTISVAWLATNFLAYRISLLWLIYARPCPCLGNLTDALHIPPQMADTAMKIVLAYLLIGSYASLFWLWRQRKVTAEILQKGFAQLQND